MIMLIFEIIGAIGVMLFLATLITGARQDGYTPLLADSHFGTHGADRRD
jgi:hypothetical protein